MTTTNVYATKSSLCRLNQKFSTGGHWLTYAATKAKLINLLAVLNTASGRAVATTNTDEKNFAEQGAIGVEVFKRKQQTTKG